MIESRDIGQSETYEDESGLDPREAARLLEQTRRQAQLGLDFRSPQLTLIAAAVALIVFGAVWLSVRGQHPYKGPTPAGLAVLYVLVAIRIGSVIYAHRHATAGVSGRSVRRLRAEGATLAVALIAVYVVRAALAVGGASDAIVYGVYPRAHSSRKKAVGSKPHVPGTERSLLNPHHRGHEIQTAAPGVTGPGGQTTLRDPIWPYMSSPPRRPVLRGPRSRSFAACRSW